jgi:hypothetical protein
MSPTEITEGTPTIAPSTLAPVTASPSEEALVTVTPTTSPVAKTTYNVSFDTILLNFMIQSPIKPTTNAYARESLHAELRAVTERHALRYVRSELKDTTETMVEAVSANVSSVSLLAPWFNGTVVATHTVSGIVIFGPNHGPPRAQAINNIVHGAFRDVALLAYLRELGAANDTTLRKITAVYMGLPSDILPTVATTDAQSDASSSSSRSIRSKMKHFFSDWVHRVEWGDWQDRNFIIFFVTTTTFALWVCGLCTFCACRRRRRRRHKRGEGSFTELHDKSKSTDTEPQSPAPTQHHDEPTPNDSATPAPESPLLVANDDGTNYNFPYYEEAPPPSTPPSANGKEGESMLRESMDSMIEAAFDQSSLTHRSVDAVMMSRMKNVMEDDMESSLSNGSVGRSETTSVYSYIDTKSAISEDEPNYSFGVAVATNLTNMEDDQSSSWSVPGVSMTISDMKGLDLHKGPAPSPPPRTPVETPQKLEHSSSSRGTGRMVSATAASTPEASNLMIFCDGNKSDDSVSLINDSVIVSAIDNLYDDFPGSRHLMSSKTEAMTTNSRVAAVVASLEAKLDGSPESQLSKNLVNYGMPKSPSSSGRSEQKESPVSEATDTKPDSRSPSGSISSQRVSDEEDRSSVGSVSLASYAAPAYKRERAAHQPIPEQAEVSATVVNDTVATKPPVHRSQSTGVSSDVPNVPRPSKEHQRGRSASPAKYPLRSSGFKSSWGGVKPSGSFSAESDHRSNDVLFQQQQESTAKALAFWNKSSGKSSRASKMVLDEERSPGDSSPSQHSPTETLISLVRSPAAAAEEYYQESESDIQSICSYDDRSLFSFAKSRHDAESQHSLGVYPTYSAQPQSLLGTQRLPSTSMDGSEDYNAACQ